MSYEKYYPNGWQSGETGGTPITPEALNHMEEGIQNSAPGGCGLGSSAIAVTNLDKAVKCGWSYFTTGCANAPFDYGVVETIDRNGNQSVQIAFNPYMGSNSAGEICIRSDNNGWLPWEYLNPPMRVGTEYRTLEKYLGKPVYAKVVDCGVLPATDLKKVAYSTVAVTPISVTLVLSDGCVLGAGYGKNLNISNAFGLNLDATKYNVRIRTEGDFSSLTANAIVKYTKD